MNVYLCPFLATMAFPTLFPDGRGDPTNQTLYPDIPFPDRIKQSLKYGEKSGKKWIYCFALHLRFASMLRFEYDPQEMNFATRFVFTFSFADMHWLQLQPLFNDGNNSK